MGFALKIPSIKTQLSQYKPPVSLNPAPDPVACLENDHFVSGLFEQVGSGESRDARAHNDDFFPLAPTLSAGKSIPEEVKEDVGPLLVWVAVSGVERIQSNFQIDVCYFSDLSINNTFIDCN